METSRNQATMSRGGSYGGGQSSLGYLFGADEQPNNQSPVTQMIQSPYGIDIMTTEKPKETEKSVTQSPPETQKNVTNNYHRAEGQNLGNFITGRPSTKVKSAPGGDSSLGYLFGDK